MVKMHYVSTIPDEQIINELIALDNKCYNKEFELVTILHTINSFFMFI